MANLIGDFMPENRQGTVSNLNDIYDDLGFERSGVLEAWAHIQEGKS
jgi:hypothetical protein